MRSCCAATLPEALVGACVTGRSDHALEHHVFPHDLVRKVCQLFGIMR
jgi:hypothetical protein